MIQKRFDSAQHQCADIVAAKVYHILIFLIDDRHRHRAGNRRNIRNCRIQVGCNYLNSFFFQLFFFLSGAEINIYNIQIGNGYPSVYAFAQLLDIIDCKFSLAAAVVTCDNSDSSVVSYHRFRLQTISVFSHNTFMQNFQ